LSSRSCAALIELRMMICDPITSVCMMSEPDRGPIQSGAQVDSTCLDHEVIPNSSDHFLYVTHSSCEGMLNRLPTIGRRLGPGGYDNCFLLEYHTNRVKLNKIVNMSRGIMSDRARMDIASVCGGLLALEGKECARSTFMITSLACVTAQEYQKIGSRLT
jgi:hypothetical protein